MITVRPSKLLCFVQIRQLAYFAETRLRSSGEQSVFFRNKTILNSQRILRLKSFVRFGPGILEIFAKTIFQNKKSQARIFQTFFVTNKLDLRKLECSSLSDTFNLVLYLWVRQGAYKKMQK
jgi:hypothetical protein